MAITTALTLRAVFRLALRQTEGLIGSRTGSSSRQVLRSAPSNVMPEPPITELRVVKRCNDDLCD